MPTPLPAPARHERINRLDAGGERLRDALALERVRWQQIQRRKLGRVQWPATVQRMTETIEDAPHQGVAHRRLQRAAQRDDVAAGVDAVCLAQRHEEDVMPAKADDFG